MGLIGQTWKHRKVWSLLVLIDQNKHTRHYRAQTRKHTHVFASTMQYLTQHRSTPEHKSSAAPKVCRWSIATGKRPDPFRTRKLSLPALMVLQPGGCGRVSYRRHKTTNNNSIQNLAPELSETTEQHRRYSSFSPIAFGSAASVVRVVHVGGVIHGGDVVGTASCLFSVCLPVR